MFTFVFQKNKNKKQQKYEKLDLPNEVVLVLNSEGVKLIGLEDKKELVSLPYREISSWRFSQEQISMKIGGMVQRAQINMRGQTDKGQEICHTMSMYFAALNSSSGQTRELMPR